MSDGPSEAEIAAAMRLVTLARETIGAMISAGAIPERVCVTLGAVLGEAVARTMPGAGDAQLIAMAVETAANWLGAHGRPVPLLVATADPEEANAPATQH